MLRAGLEARRVFLLKADVPRGTIRLLTPFPPNIVGLSRTGDQVSHGRLLELSRVERNSGR
jgi:hypothetical protein